MMKNTVNFKSASFSREVKRKYDAKIIMALKNIDILSGVFIFMIAKI